MISELRCSKSVRQVLVPLVVLEERLEECQEEELGEYQGEVQRARLVLFEEEEGERLQCVAGEEERGGEVEGRRQCVVVVVHHAEVVAVVAAAAAAVGEEGPDVVAREAAREAAREVDREAGREEVLV